MKNLYIITLALVLFSCKENGYSQISLKNLQKLALLNSNNVYTLPIEIKEILQPKEFKDIGGGKWIKSTTSNDKELITIMVNYNGITISYEVYNLPNSKTTIQSIKKYGNFVFNNDEDLKTHFRNTDKKLWHC